MRVIHAIVSVLVFGCFVGALAGCDGISSTAPSVSDGAQLIHPDRPLSLHDIDEIAASLEPDEVVAVHVADLDTEARDELSALVSKALTGDSLLRISTDHDDGYLEARGRTVCTSTVIYSPHRTGCRGKAVPTISYSRFYSGCPHRGYVTSNPGIIVKGFCGEHSCPYAIYRSKSFHRRI